MIQHVYWHIVSRSPKSVKFRSVALASSIFSASTPPQYRMTDWVHTRPPKQKNIGYTGDVSIIINNIDITHLITWWFDKYRGHYGQIMQIYHTCVLFDSPRCVIQWPLKNPVLPLHQLLSLHWCAPWHRYTPKVPSGKRLAGFGIEIWHSKKKHMEKGCRWCKLLRTKLCTVIQSLTYPNVRTLDDIRREMDPSRS